METYDWHWRILFGESTPNVESINISPTIFMNYYCASYICPWNKTVDLYAISSLWRNLHVIRLIFRTRSPRFGRSSHHDKQVWNSPPKKTKNNKLLEKELPYCPRAQQATHTPWAALGGTNKMNYFIRASNSIQGYEYWDSKVNYVIHIYFSYDNCNICYWKQFYV